MTAVAQEAIVIPMTAQRRAPLPVSPAMLEAGIAAFKRHRRSLDDLYACFECDRDAFLRAVYRAMASAERA